MPPKRPRPQSSATNPGPSDMDLDIDGESGSKFPQLSGDFIQYPTEDTDPHPGIGNEDDLERNAIALLDHTRRSTFHPVTASLVFLCYVIPGLHTALRFGGVPVSSHLAQPQTDSTGNIRYTIERFYGRDDTRIKPTQLEVSSILSHCCTLLIGVVIGSSEKVRAEAVHIKKRFKTLMVTFGRGPHGDAANLLRMYNPGAAVDWINSQPWAGSLILGLLTTDFKSPGKESMDQIKLVAGYAQLTTYTTIKEYLNQCMDATITITAVAGDIGEFLDVEEKPGVPKFTITELYK